MNYKEIQRQAFLDMLAKEGLAVRMNDPEFLAGQWQPDNANGGWYSQCYEFIGGKWEGFTAVKRNK
jgi:hypothetical protein